MLRPRGTQSGLSLIELMVALTISLLLLAGLTTIFVNSSTSNRELLKAAQQIENGRYALDTLGTDLRLAGYYGVFGTPPDATSVPDPCATSVSIPPVATDALNISSLTYPVQGVRAADLSTRPDVSAWSCGTWLTSANLAPGSDIVVVRRAETNVFTGTPTAGDVYLQANTVAAALQVGVAAASVPTKNVDNTDPAILKKSGAAADTRRFNVHVYFVAPCSAGTGYNGVCQSSDGSVPTLKRLVLGGATMTIEPLVEGIQYLKLEYGADTAPSAVDPTTGLSGDGVVETYTATPSASQWPLVISARVSLLARSTEGSVGYTDIKTYSLGTGVAVPAQNDRFKRHVYTAEFRINNAAGRREAPTP
ncbi:MAG: PilW family protein [Betaproteobacteria bacterium]|nr:PilW family protein [Betaproteobacteria bacterium]